MEQIYSDKSLRTEVYDRFVSILREDDHDERRSYTRELADYAQEMLSSAAAACDLNASREALQQSSSGPRYSITPEVAEVIPEK